MGEFYFHPPSGVREQVRQSTCEDLINANAAAADIIGRDIGAGLQACAKAVADFPDQPLFSRLLQAAQEQQSFQRALTSRDAAPSHFYLGSHPNGRFADAVRTHLARLDPNAYQRPPVPVPTPAPAPPSAEGLAKLLQGELKRVGCYAGRVDGDWNRSSENAVRSFNRHARTRLEGKYASLDALESVRGKTQAVCPIGCGTGQKWNGKSCVAVKAEKPKQNQTAQKPASGGSSACNPSMDVQVIARTIMVEGDNRFAQITVCRYGVISWQNVIRINLKTNEAEGL